MATEENTYFLRSFLLLVEGGLYISRETLRRECQNAGGNLNALLKQFENKLKHEFHGKQYDKLFPQYGTTDINKWDLQLSVGVLINVFGRSLSLPEKQKLRALRDLRNEIYMHCASASLDQKKYEEVQEELEDIITTLAATFDKPVRDRCSAYITQFATGPLDGVKPSLATLNGFSQTCQKKLKVGLHTELVVGGPSDYWIDLCEHTLDTILNNADSMASEGAGFEEIEKNVKKMLEFLLANKNVVFKGSKKACIILMFECNSYDDALLFLKTLDSQEFRDHLSMISDALLRHYQFDATISISASVRTQCLQSILMDILKLSSSEEVAHRHLEISSEIDDHAKPMQGTEEEFSQKAESKHPLRLDLECTSKNGLLHILNSFKNDDFSGHLKSVADALSKHLGKNITLNASLDVDDVMAAIEEAVSRDSTRCMALQHDSEATDLHEDKSKFDISSATTIILIQTAEEDIQSKSYLQRDSVSTSPPLEEEYIQQRDAGFKSSLARRRNFIGKYALFLGIIMVITALCSMCFTTVIRVWVHPDTAPENQKTEIFYHTLTHMYTNNSRTPDTKMNTKGQNKQIQEHSGALPWNGNYLGLLYLQLADHSDQTKEKVLMVAQTVYSKASEMMKKFTVTATHIADTMIPMILDAVELQSAAGIKKIAGQIIKNAEEMKTETEATQQRYMEIQTEVQKIMASLASRNKEVVSENKTTRVEMEGEKQLAKAGKLAQKELDEEKLKMEEEVTVLKSKRDKWMEQAANLGNVESLYIAHEQLGNADKQFIEFWSKVAAALKALRTESRSWSVYLYYIENPKHAERLKVSIGLCKKRWEGFGRVCSDYVQKSGTEIYTLYNSLSALTDTYNEPAL